VSVNVSRYQSEVLRPRYALIQDHLSETEGVLRRGAHEEVDKCHASNQEKANPS